ncbi:hypothetical protein ACFQX7_30825 [Luedemannella flava]
MKAARTLTGWGDPARLAAAVDLLERHGSAPLPTDAFDRLAAATGMSPSEAALLLAGLPGLSTWENNFLTPEDRARLGLKVDTLRMARDALRQLAAADRWRCSTRPCRPTRPTCGARAPTPTGSPGSGSSGSAW